MPKTVVVLGCGPAGLFAAHAVKMAGHNVVIVSRKRKSEMYGAQYLHAPIPGLSSSSFQMKYRLMGTPREYATKVYGPTYRGTVSPEELGTDHEAWDIREAYDAAWRAYSDKIIDVTFTEAGMVAALLDKFSDKFAAEGGGVAHYISTIGAPNFCSSQLHSFQAEKVWAIGDAPERGTFCPIQVSAPNEVLCDGRPETSWYRSANVLGYRTAEWPANKKPPFDGVSEVHKPIATNCDCLPQVQRVGRYGKWQKGVLSHSAFYETYYGLTGVEWQ